MTATHRRHDITDRVGELLEPHLADGPGKKGRPSRDNRLFLNAVFWNLHTGVPRYQIRGVSGSPCVHARVTRSAMNAEKR